VGMWGTYPPTLTTLKKMKNFSFLSIYVKLEPAGKLK